MSPPGGGRIAALDVGTNTVRLLIARMAAAGQLEPLHYALRITRLGGGAKAAGLAADAIDRTVSAIADFARLVREAGVVRFRAVATSAAREARNGDELVRRARVDAGIDLAIISGAEEAALALAGARWSLGRLPGGLPDRFVLVDVGGGSTEVVVAAREGKAGGWRDEVRSLPIGTVRLVEHHLRSDPPAPAELARMEEAIEEELAAGLPPALLTGAGEPLSLVGTAGTVTTLAAMDLGLSTYDQDRVQGHRLHRGALDALFGRLAALPAAARLALPGLERGREDLIVPGLAIVLAIMRRLRSRALTVVDAGLLEGLCLCEAGGPP